MATPYFSVEATYDSGKASRGAAIGAGALAIGAIVAVAATDGEDAAAVDAARPFANVATKDLQNMLIGNNKLLSQLWGVGVKGANDALENPVVVEGLKKEILHAYREIGLRAIENDLNSTGIHNLRLKIVENALAKF